MGGYCQDRPVPPAVLNFSGSLGPERGRIEEDYSMSHPPLRIGLIALALAANIAGCARSNHSAGPTAPIVDPTADWVTVSGTVTGIDDQRPVDGDLSILVRTPGPVEERLYIEARWQYPVPTSPETIQLFTNVLQLGVGDFIVATGERTSAGVRLASLHRLDR